VQMPSAIRERLSGLPFARYVPGLRQNG